MWGVVTTANTPRRVRVTLDDDTAEYLAWLSATKDYPGAAKYINQVLRDVMRADPDYDRPDVVAERLAEAERRQKAREKSGLLADARLTPEGRKIKAKRILASDPTVDGALRAYKLGMGLKEIRAALSKNDYTVFRETVRRIGT